MKTNMYNFEFSKRSDWSFQLNVLARELNQIKNDHLKYLDLTCSNPTKCGFQYPSQEIISALSNEKNIYYEPCESGLDTAREAVRNYYQENGIHISLDQIYLTSSTSEAYSVLFRLLVDIHEQVLLPQPSYPLFQFLTDINDVDLEHYALNSHDSWKIDIDHLRQLISKKTKMVAVVNPNNPTGSYVGKEELRQLNQLAQENDLCLLSDEVFWDFCHDHHTDRQSFASNQEVLTFTLGGLSKTLGLPQMKVSWIIINGPEQIVKVAGQRLGMILDTYLSVNTPAQNAFPVWMGLREDIQSIIQQRIHDNQKILQEHLLQSPLTTVQIQGGWYGVLKLPQGISDEDFALDLLKSKQVLVQPGYLYDFCDDTYFVLSLITNREDFEEGIRRICGFFS